VLALVLLVVPSSVAAQGITYGVKGGINFATLDIDPDEDSEAGNRIGIVAGGFVALPLGARLTIQPEGLYSQKGQKADFEGVEAALELDYIEVPVLVKFRLTSGGFHVFGGPSMAFKVRSRAVASFGGTTVETGEDDIIKDSDFGVVFGAGQDFGKWSIDGRYTMGLSNIGEADDDDQKVRNRVISVLAGIRF
jgi:hypothetical protein